MTQGKVSKPGTVRRDPETKRVATKMDPSVTAGAWFVLDLVNGGYYSDGVREKVAEWPEYPGK